MAKQKEIKPIVQKFDDGLSFKLYSHFDRPYSLYSKSKDGSGKLKIQEKSAEIIENKRKHIIEILKNPDEIAKHSFYPLIAYNIEERHSGKINKMKYDKQYYEKKIAEAKTEEDKQKYTDELKKSQSPEHIKKSRTIRYAAHFDGFIYLYYAKIINEKYEEKIKEYGLENEVLAYRKAPDDKNSHRHDNATIAKEVFNEIKNRNCQCVALAFDIKSFFDCIDHKNLKKAWRDVLNAEKLPDDHHNVFKSLTKYSYIDMKDICKYFNQHKHQKCKKDCEKCQSPKLPRLMFKNAGQFREFKNWCKAENKIQRNPGLFVNPETNIPNVKNPYGIPQGSPMSALLSNIYMLPFDKAMKDLATELGGHYRRYCDDIMFICKPEGKDTIQTKIKEAIKERGECLIIHTIVDDYQYSKSQCYDFTDAVKINKFPLQYLGFEFDGKKIRIRKQSMARYYRKSKRAVTASFYNARKRLKKLYKNNGLNIENKHKKLYREDLYKRYTHLGRHNFISYAYRAFNSIEDTAIKTQVKSHFDRLNKLIEEYDVRMEQLCNNLVKNTK